MVKHPHTYVVFPFYQAKKRCSKTGTVFSSNLQTTIMAEYTRGLDLSGNEDSGHNKIEKRNSFKNLPDVGFEEMNYEQRRRPYNNEEEDRAAKGYKADSDKKQRR